MESRDNTLSKRAFDFINEHKATYSETEKEKAKKKEKAADIRTELEGLPAKIKINGLSQTLIFLLEKSKTDNSGNEQNDRYLIGKELVEYLASTQKKLQKSQTGKQLTDYPEEAYKICSNNLRHATAEAVAYTAWLKRMAKAIIPKKETGKAKNEVSDEN
ncbi:type III-B CRISPR module-associated protein Cmr5 [Desulfovibrio gilichinskyi]|uniref:CRISPR type III-B/RAMP module-associated protein Cmr5 n=1 Tax=Desulfovibrio gilichinskyi TaxID=1519643 RepID=A0A1X7D6J6_9BACT|nr:type III-B CRISPR module-associated protein Cmr5 [Desulfovibrio gilichinskyi]SMF09832.1 CRISPR-associated protein Cmr5 [Desulfovibrio gilichinskyi]